MPFENSSTTYEKASPVQFTCFGYKCVVCHLWEICFVAFIHKSLLNSTLYKFETINLHDCDICTNM